MLKIFIEKVNHLCIIEDTQYIISRQFKYHNHMYYTKLLKYLLYQF